MDWAAGGDGGASSAQPSSPRAPPGGPAPGGGAFAATTAGGAPPAAAAATQSEAESSRARVLEFLQRHTAYELLPESSKVVLLDTQLPVRQAFHALFEQSMCTAPLWDARRGRFCGLISPSDFIALLCFMEQGGPSSLSEAQLDSLTIEAWMSQAAQAAAAAAAGTPPQPTSGEHNAPPLVTLSPEDSLQSVAHALLRSGCSALPMLSSMPLPAASATPPGAALPGAARAGGAAQLLHLCTMGGVLSCLMRHFRGVPAALPLLSQPIGALPLGTWLEGGGRGGSGGRHLVTAHPSVPLKQALAMLLQAGVGALPIVDEAGVLLDVYGAHSLRTGLDSASDSCFDSAERHPGARAQQRLLAAAAGLHLRLPGAQLHEGWHGAAAERGRLHHARGRVAAAAAAVLHVHAGRLVAHRDGDPRAAGRQQAGVRAGGHAAHRGRGYAAGHRGVPLPLGAERSRELPPPERKPQTTAACAKNLFRRDRRDCCGAPLETFDASTRRPCPVRTQSRTSIESRTREAPCRSLIHLTESD